jgi:hypothetical protein
MAHDSSRSRPTDGGVPPTDPSETQTPDPLPEEAARYIADFASELAALARRSRLDLLASLLDMARLEAIEIMQGRRGTDAD